MKKRDKKRVEKIKKPSAQLEADPNFPERVEDATPEEIAQTIFAVADGVRQATKSR